MLGDFPDVRVDKFRPKAMVKVKQTEVLRAKYPAIDAHNHFRDDMDPAKVVDDMDQCNVRTYIDLSGWNGDRLKRRLELLKGKYADRFAVFFVPDFKRIDEPNFGENMARELEEAVRNGAQGLKIYKVLGLTVKDMDGKRVPVDDARLEPMWEAAGQLGVPVMIHVADPHAFFEPMDERNERYGELIQHPDWHFLGGDFPPLRQLFDERDHLLEKHPRTTFIGAHIGSESEDLDRASEVLDRYPNWVVDFSARAAEVGRQPRRAREFFLKYQDRILFGTDEFSDPAMYRSYFRLLETDDECFEYNGWPTQGLWLISGLYLPDPVLYKLYITNPMRVIPGITIPNMPPAPSAS